MFPRQLPANCCFALLFTLALLALAWGCGQQVPQRKEPVPLIRYLGE